MARAARGERFKALLDSEESAVFLCSDAQRLDRADVPVGIVSSLALGRLTALDKGDGRVRGIVSGDILIVFVGRTFAQQYRDNRERAVKSVQFALSTRGGADAAHAASQH